MLKFRTSRKLERLTVSNNMLKGRVKDVFNPQNVALHHIDLSGNLFTGPIELPQNIIKSLQTLALSANCFSGTLSPAVFCTMQNIEYLFMDGLSTNAK